VRIRRPVSQLFDDSLQPCRSEDDDDDDDDVDDVVDVADAGRAVKLPSHAVQVRCLYMTCLSTIGCLFPA